MLKIYMTKIEKKKRYSIIINNDDDKMIESFECDRVKIIGELVECDFIFSQIVYNFCFENCSKKTTYGRINADRAEFFYKKNSFPNTKFITLKIYNQLIS